MKKCLFSRERGARGGGLTLIEFFHPFSLSCTYSTAAFWITVLLYAHTTVRLLATSAIESTVHGECLIFLSVAIIYIMYRYSN